MPVETAPQSATQTPDKNQVIEQPAIEATQIPDIHKAEVMAYAADVAMTEAVNLKADTAAKQTELRDTKADLAEKPDASVPQGVVNYTDKLLDEAALQLEDKISSQNKEDDKLRTLATRDAEHAELRYDQGKPELPSTAYGRISQNITTNRALKSRESAIRRDLDEIKHK